MGRPQLTRERIESRVDLFNRLYHYAETGHMPKRRKSCPNLNCRKGFELRMSSSGELEDDTCRQCNGQGYIETDY